MSDSPQPATSPIARLEGAVAAVLGVGALALMASGVLFAMTMGRTEGDTTTSLIDRLRLGTQSSTSAFYFFAFGAVISGLRHPRSPAIRRFLGIVGVTTVAVLALAAVLPFIGPSGPVYVYRSLSIAYTTIYLVVAVAVLVWVVLEETATEPLGEDIGDEELVIVDLEE